MYVHAHNMNARVLLCYYNVYIMLRKTVILEVHKYICYNTNAQHLSHCHPVLIMRYIPTEFSCAQTPETHAVFDNSNDYLTHIHSVCMHTKQIFCCMYIAINSI